MHPWNLDFHIQHLAFKAVPGWGVVQQNRTLSLSLSMWKALVSTPSTIKNKNRACDYRFCLPCLSRMTWNEHLLAISAFHFEKGYKLNSAPHQLTESSQKVQQTRQSTPHLCPPETCTTVLCSSQSAWLPVRSKWRKKSFPRLFLRKGCDVWCQKDLKNKYNVCVWYVMHTHTYISKE